MTKTRLTDLTIRTLTPPPKGQKTYWERGFGVRVSQGGSKSFVCKVQGRLITIARYPTMTLAEARKEAQRLQVQEPEKKRLERLSEARTAYLSECEVKNRPNTVRMYRQYLNELSTTYLTDITRTDVPLDDPHRVTAWKVFFNWCLRNELVERNPFAMVSATTNQRDRVLTDDEVRAVFTYDYPPFSDYLKVLLLTGQRRGQFTNYELQHDTVYFPASVMKGKVAHTLPLTPVTKQLLHNLQPFNGWSNGKRRFDTHHPLPHWTLHDLRRTFSTTMARLGVPLHVTEQILAHRSGTISGVAAIYNKHDFMQESRAALTRYEEHLQTVVA